MAAAIEPFKDSPHGSSSASRQERPASADEVDRYEPLGGIVADSRVIAVQHYTIRKE